MDNKQKEREAAAIAWYNKQFEIYQTGNGVYPHRGDYLAGYDTGYDAGQSARPEPPDGDLVKPYFELLDRQMYLRAWGYDGPIDDWVYHACCAFAGRDIGIKGSTARPLLAVDQQHAARADAPADVCCVLPLLRYTIADHGG